MKKFTNPLDKIKIASPCGADWNEMRGDERRRFCSLCELNVYNLSDLTRAEAESFLINSEGRVCLRVFRRADGSVITRDCPVGWARIKKRVSRAATAVFSLIAGFFGGIFALETSRPVWESVNKAKSSETITLPTKEENFQETDSSTEKISFGGMVSNLTEIKKEILKSQDI